MIYPRLIVTLRKLSNGEVFTVCCYSVKTFSAGYRLVGLYKSRVARFDHYELVEVKPI